MTLELVKTAQEPRRLDRAKWHKPLVSVIVTHFNYSDHVEDALLSLLDQTHENWECVVVDDGSDPAHVLAVEAIIERIGCEKIRLVSLENNIGQIEAFFAGLSYTRGQFVCPLDPDDRYDERFLEAALAAHLNETVICPLVCTDQHLLRDGGVISGVNSGYRLAKARWSNGIAEIADDTDLLLFVPASRPGWHWTSTSSLMLRRSALILLYPHEAIPTRKCLDSYLAQGCHVLGGTIFVAEPLVYRSLHASNSWIKQDIYSSFGTQQRPDGVNLSAAMKALAIAALRLNGVEIGPEQTAQKRPGLLAKWRRSFDKRWRRLTGAGQ